MWGIRRRDARRLLPRNSAPEQWRFAMRKTILTILGSALLAASTVQIAAAAEHPKARKIYRPPAPPVTEKSRTPNAYGPAPYAEPDWSRYQNGAGSAPAGR